MREANHRQQTVLASLVESKTVLFISHFVNNAESKARKLGMTPRCCSNRRFRARIALAIVRGQLLRTKHINVNKGELET